MRVCKFFILFLKISSQFQWLILAKGKSCKTTDIIVFAKIFISVLWGGGRIQWPPVWVRACLFESMKIAYDDKWIMEIFQGSLYVELK
jgi:hypothetical protein